ncbi:MAG: MBL fold metallo-hydrolase [Candidatus Dependentiae bacterium]
MKKQKQRLYPHVQHGRFYNYPNENPEGFFFRSFYIYLKSYINRFFYHPNTSEWQMQLKPIVRSAKPVITWIGHSTFLIQMNGINILTDPIFGDATSLFPRILQPGITLAQLPPIDYVVISHNHLDHMDEPALTVLKERNPYCRYLVPLGDKAWFDKRAFTHVREYTWWQQDSFVLSDIVTDRVTFTFLPAFHWSQRGMFDKNRSLWGSWMIEIGGKKIYFGGDTAYAKHFKSIGVEFGQIDCAILPIGPCEPHKWMKYSHANAYEAFQAFKDLNAHHFIPMHWGTYYFGTDTFDMPIKLLNHAWQSAITNKQVSQEQLHILRAGQRIDLPLASDMPIIELPKEIQR